MTDHPLVPQHIRSYMENHQIEANLNRALNSVLSTQPQDPFSSMAVSLIESNESFPQFVKMEAHETIICNLGYPSIEIDVFMSF
jgi:hypothetical protein